MAGFAVDAGVLSAYERRDIAATTFFEGAARQGLDIILPVPVLAQVWRGPRTARIGALLDNRAFVEPMTRADGMLAGLLCGAAGTSDVVDAGLVAAAIRFHADVLTADMRDVSLLTDVARRLGVGSCRVIDIRDR